MRSKFKKWEISKLFAKTTHKNRTNATQYRTFFLTHHNALKLSHIFQLVISFTVIKANANEIKRECCQWRVKQMKNETISTHLIVKQLDLHSQTIEFFIKLLWHCSIGISFMQKVHWIRNYQSHRTICLSIWMENSVWNSSHINCYTIQTC